MNLYSKDQLIEKIREISARGWHRSVELKRRTSDDLDEALATSHQVLGKGGLAICQHFRYWSVGVIPHPHRRLHGELHTKSSVPI